MIDDRAVELMNGEMDGENSPAESREFAQLLESSDEARAYYEELLALDGRLQGAGTVKPPRDLRARILSKTTRAPARRRSRRTLLIPDNLLEAFSPRLAYGFAAGVAAGLVAFALLAGWDATPTAPADALRGSLLAWELASEAESAREVQFELPEGLVEGRVSYAGPHARLDLTVTTDGPAELVLRYGEQVRFDGLVAPDDADSHLNVVESETRLMHSGSGDYVVYLSNPRGELFPIEILVCGEGGVCYAESVDPGP